MHGVHVAGVQFSAPRQAKRAGVARPRAVAAGVFTPSDDGAIPGPLRRSRARRVARKIIYFYAKNYMLENIINKFRPETIRNRTDKKKSLLEKQGFKPYELMLENGIKLEARDKQGELELILEKDGQELFDFKSLVPQETKFVYKPNDRWSIDRKNPKEPILNFVDFKSMVNLLLYLHEVGHLNNPELADALTKAKAVYNEERKKDETNDWPKSRYQALYNKRKAVLLSERKAFIYALRKIKELEENFKINIFDRIGQPREILKKIKYCVNEEENKILGDLHDENITDKKELVKHLNSALDEDKVLPWQKDRPESSTGDWAWKRRNGKWVRAPEESGESNDEISGQINA